MNVDCIQSQILAAAAATRASSAPHHVRSDDSILMMKDEIIGRVVCFSTRDRYGSSSSSSSLSSSASVLQSQDESGCGHVVPPREDDPKSLSVDATLNQLLLRPHQQRFQRCRNPNNSKSVQQDDSDTITTTGDDEKFLVPRSMTLLPRPSTYPSLRKNGLYNLLRTRHAETPRDMRTTLEKLSLKPLHHHHHDGDDLITHDPKLQYQQQQGKRRAETFSSWLDMAIDLSPLNNNINNKGTSSSSSKHQDQGKRRAETLSSMLDMAIDMAVYNNDDDGNEEGDDREQDLGDDLDRAISWHLRHGIEYSIREGTDNNDDDQGRQHRQADSIDADDLDDDDDVDVDDDMDTGSLELFKLDMDSVDLYRSRHSQHGSNKRRRCGRKPDNFESKTSFFSSSSSSCLDSDDEEDAIEWAE